MGFDKVIYTRLLEAVQGIPVIDCHEHMQGLKARPPYKEPIASLIHGYVYSDLVSASFGVSGKDLLKLQDESVSTDEKWPLFERLWSATEHTAYARVTKLVLRSVYGIEELTRESLDRVAEQLTDQTEESYFQTIDDAGIQLMLVDVLGWLEGNVQSFLDGTLTFPDKWRLLISLPGLHPTNFSKETILHYSSALEMSVTSLDGYLEVVYALFKRCIERGVVGIKDQSAYGRKISYDLVSKSDAENIFNRALCNPNNSVGWPEGKPLNDFLFHRYMEFARELDMPVQIHTGHMAGIRNRVDKTNAANLATVLEVHQDVRFDLFHGNWPYLGDLLFLGKNYPNVSLDCCWLHIIDPEYSVELLERATLTLPHTKVHGFGGDYGDTPEFVAGHLQIARQNIAIALTNLVERGWLDEARADSLARDWLFNNANQFFSLGLDEI